MDYKSINYKNIPVQAKVVAGILQLDVESPTCFRDLDAYVHSDQGVATTVMRVVNSALYSRGNNIGTIPKAISILGFRVVRSLAMMAFSRSLFAGASNPLVRTHIWQHSLLTGLAGQIISKKLGYGEHADEVFVAGLMHDIGKILMATHEPDSYQKALELGLETGISAVAAESRVLGCNHCEVGREAVLQWKLPERFIDYMGNDLSEPSAASLNDPVQFGLICANRIIGGFGIGARRIEDHADRKVQLLAWGMNEEYLARWLQDDFLEELIDNDLYKLCANV